jgi:hypothetical protein
MLDIDIAVSVARVWSVLYELDAFRQWWEALPRALKDKHMYQDPYTGARVVHPTDTEIQTLRFRAEARRDELSEPVQVAAANPGGISGAFLGPVSAYSLAPPQFGVTGQSQGQPQGSRVLGKRPVTDVREGQPGPSNTNKRRIRNVDLPVAGQDVAGPILQQVGRASNMDFQMNPHSQVFE